VLSKKGGKGGAERSESADNFLTAEKELSEDRKRERKRGTRKKRRSQIQKVRKDTQINTREDQRPIRKDLVKERRTGHSRGVKEYTAQTKIKPERGSEWDRNEEFNKSDARSTTRDAVSH